jgi:hypothetical protein
MTLPVLTITGPCGVGKTTTAAALSDLLDERGLSHALIDLDWLRWCHPSPPDDPFHEALGLRNLAALWSEYRAAGAERLILVDIVETRETVSRYRAALPNAEIQVVRLGASMATIHRRLEGRENGSSLEWHQNRAVELAEMWERSPSEDYIHDTEGMTPLEVALAILRRAGWIESP